MQLQFIWQGWGLGAYKKYSEFSILSIWRYISTKTIDLEYTVYYVFFSFYDTVRIG